MNKKNKERIYQLIASFMISIIISLPFYSADVFAVLTDGLSRISVKGIDNIGGIVRDENDTFNFKARAYIPTEIVIEKNQVRLGGYNNNTGFAFNSCSAVGDASFDCTFSRVMDDESICDSYDFDIYLYADSGSYYSQETARVVCDKQSAKISSFSANKTLFKQSDSIKFSYNVYDKARLGSPPNECAGLKKVELYKNSVASSNLIATDNSLSGCSYSGFLLASGSSFSEGANNVYLKVYDKFDQASESSISITGDFTGPNISDSVKTQAYKDINGNEIQYFTPQTVNIIFSVEIRGNDIDINSVEADLSSLNLGTEFPSCPAISGGKTICTWNTNARIENSAFSANVGITAADMLGNSITKTLTLSNTFTVDSINPVAMLGQATVTALDGTEIGYFIPQNVLLNFNINVSDSGSGVKKENITADFSGWNIISEGTKSCSPNSGALIKCSFSNVKFHIDWNDLQNVNQTAKRFSKNILINASDNVGNHISNTANIIKDLTVDLSQPAVAESEANLKIVDASGNPIPYFFKQNAKLSFNFTISDSGAGIDTSTIKANLSALGLGENVPYKRISGQKFIWGDLTVFLESPDPVYVITIFGKDNVGNNLTSTVTLKGHLEQDPNAPAINGLRIVDSAGKEFSGIWIGNKTFNAVVSVNITESETNLDVNSVYANLSKLNPSLGIIKGICSAINSNVSRCSWNIVLNLIDAGTITKEIWFNASDIAGKSAGSGLGIKLISVFKVDVTGPVINSITTQKSNNGINYIKATNNTFTVSFIESESGLNETKVFLDLSSLSGDFKKAATRCEGSSCYWENFATTKGNGIYDTMVHQDSIDIVGNKIKSSSKINATLDISAPIVEDVSYRAIQGTTKAYEGIVQTGNALEITAIVTEETSLTATANVSSIIVNGEQIVNGDCSLINETQHQYSCIFDTDVIDKKGYIVNKLYFKFTDFIGNTEEWDIPIVVLEAANKTVDYWAIEQTAKSPFAIDRELIEFYQPFIWFSFKLNPKIEKPLSKVYPIELNLIGCEGNNTKFLASENGNKPELSNFNPQFYDGVDNEYDIHLKYLMEQTDPKEDLLPITCRLNIRTIVDNKTVSMLEEENLSVVITYFNNELGKIDKRVENEIEEVKGGWLVQAEWIETVDKLMRYAKVICGVMDKLQQIQLIWAFIKDLWGGACNTAEVSLGTTSASCAAAMATGSITEGYKATSELWFKGFDKWCKIFSCGMTREGWDKDGAMAKWADAQEGSVFALGGYPLDKKWFNPESSIILSVVYLCIPGITYNLQKARVIDCQYISCLKETENGMPIEICTRQRSYSYCKYVWGQIFHLIPFADAISNIGQNVLKALSHPLEMVGFLVKINCYYGCINPKFNPIIPCSVCTYIDFFNMAADILCDLGIGGDQCQPIWESLTVDDSVCKSALQEDKGSEKSGDEGGFLGGMFG